MLRYFIVIGLLFSATSTRSIAQAVNWATSFRSNTFGCGKAIETDSVGNVYTIGVFNNSCTSCASPDTFTDFDPGVGNQLAAASDDEDFYVSKLDALGNFVWVKVIEGVAFAYDLNVDDAGNVFVTGTFQDTVDFDPDAANANHMSNGESDLFVLKLNGNGGFEWVSCIGGSDMEGTYGMAVDSIGNVYVTGICHSDSFDLDPGAGTLEYYDPTPSTSQAILIKLTSSGTYEWSRMVDADAMSNSVWGLYVTLSGNELIYSGLFSGEADFDFGAGVNLLSGISGDVFVSKVDLDGNFLWAKRFGSSAVDVPHGVDVNTEGSIYVAYDRDYHLFILRLDPLGNTLWQRAIIGTQWDETRDLKIDRAGFIYCVGSFDNLRDFDPGPGEHWLNPPGYKSMFMVKLDSAGYFIDAFPLHNNVYGICFDAERTMYLTGSFYGSFVDFDPDTAAYQLSSGWDAPPFNNELADNAYVMKRQHKPCSDIMVAIDSVATASCSNSGFVVLHTYNGTPPYNYIWDNGTTGPTASLPGGIQSWQVIDSTGCQKSGALFIPGPGVQNGIDLSVNVVSTDFRPGFDTDIKVHGLNNGCDPQSGQLRLVLDTFLVFNSAAPLPSSVSGDTLKWDFTDLTFYQNEVLPIVNVTTSVQSQIGDTIKLSASILPLSLDVDSSNNIKYYEYPVINGYDPNDKSVYPVGECAPRYVHKSRSLTYTIRFQNTGNGVAQNVYILDTLDADLDLTTLRNVFVSHPSVIVEILPTNVLKFLFNNIQLPDSNSNETGSHGYLVFSIDPYASSVNGTAVNNSASIFFDYNEPVKTNTVLNTLTDSIPTVNSNIQQFGNTLVAADNQTGYMWITCDQTSVVGFGPVFESDSSGSFMCFVSNEGCSAVSPCVELLIDNLTPMSSSTEDVVIMPNPSTTGKIVVNIPADFLGGSITVTDAIGRIVLRRADISSIEYLTLPTSSGMRHMNLISKSGVVLSKSFVVTR